jgi:hypothetical protein
MAAGLNRFCSLCAITHAVVAHESRGIAWIPRLPDERLRPRA